jgi:hypothetical protein
MKNTAHFFIALLLLSAPAARAQFTCTTNNGAITITGYTGADGNVVIPGTIDGYPVVAIGEGDYDGEGAFAGSALTMATIPASVTNIYLTAFYQCFGLTNITVNAANPSYASAGGVLFNQTMTTLVEFPGGLGDSYAIPNSVTNIDDFAFAWCTNLIKVTIPNGVTSIGNEAFFACDGMISVTIPDSVTSIGYTVFQDCDGLESVTIGSGLTNLGTYEFAYCINLTHAVIGDSVRNIGYEAFYNCSILTSVTIPDSVNSIGDGAFEGSGLTNVTLGNSVTSIGNQTFQGCSGLTSVTIPNSVTSIGNQTFLGSGLTCVTIPNSVTNIGEQAFGGCSGLTNAVIPDSVTSIGNEEFQGSGLTSVTIPDSVTNIGEQAFGACGRLTSVIIPNSVTSIGDQAFEESDLTNVTMSDIVTTIGVGAFEDCLHLTNVTIPDSVTNIGDYAFAYCSGLHQVYSQGNAPSVNGGSGSADITVFASDTGTVYYLPGTTGWGATFGGWPTALWNPQVQTTDGSFGVQSNQFGFNLTGTANLPLVVEACTNLGGVWTPLFTGYVTNGSIYFSDPLWTNYPSRFYRVRSP